MKLPKKLKTDAIVEAICEIRFETSEIPELVIGKLAGQEAWRGFITTRLALSDVPEPIRQGDPNLKFQPTLELKDPKSSRLVKISSNVVSYHVLKPYCGWDEFGPALKDVFNRLFSTFDNLQVVRLGFRYINALTAEAHQIPNVNTLNVRAEVDGEPINGPINLNYSITASDSHQVMVRIASPQFLLGPIAKNVTALVDVDVYTPLTFLTKNKSECVNWTKRAHDYEKREFFKLIPPEILKTLIEE